MIINLLSNSGNSRYANVSISKDCFDSAISADSVVFIYLWFESIAKRLKMINFFSFSSCNSILRTNQLNKYHKQKLQTIKLLWTSI